jgi:hypothetical protein
MNQSISAVGIWIMTPLCLPYVCQHVEAAAYFHPEEGAGRFRQNVGNQLPKYTMLLGRKQQSVSFDGNVYERHRSIGYSLMLIWEFVLSFIYALFDNNLSSVDCTAWSLGISA